MSLAVLTVALYGVMTLVGGVIGFVKAKSRASLIAGGVAGLLLLACAAGLGSGSRAALWGSQLIALALGIRFIGTYRRTRRVMPDLLMIVLSITTLLAVGLTSLLA